MPSSIKNFFIVLAVTLSLGLSAQASFAYWVWSPDLGKWVNPKKAAKDTPEEQFSWALGFYNQKNWDRAVEEFEKIPATFPSSRLAAEGVYYLGLCWEAKNDLAKAADNYQKLIDKYPYSDRIKDAVKREFAIADEFASGTKMKVLGVPVLSGQEKALELYKHIVKNAPYGSLGDQAQFKIGDVYKAQKEYEDAQKAYQAVVDDYPQSSLVSQARYEIAQCSMLASKKEQYDEQAAQKAIEQFQSFKDNYAGQPQAVEADESIKVLRAKKAQTAFETAQFYEKQKKWNSAQVYYEEVVNKYADTSYAKPAKEKLVAIMQNKDKPEVKKSPWHLW